MADGLDSGDVAHMATAAMLTFFLHVESRVASSIGEGFYTIGPCGEELMGALGVVLRENDPLALHYRHLATNIARSLKYGRMTPQQIALARARGYCVSSLDPVTGGAHCAIGGTAADFYVTSTLASQCTPALGRALGLSLSQSITVSSKFPADAISVVTLGDGSVHNGHFLSAMTMADAASFRGVSVPLLTCITDNGLSISYKNKGFTRRFVDSLSCKTFSANGGDAGELLMATTEAAEYARTIRKPCVLYIHSLVRRFGHAATDRQSAYLTQKEIDTASATDSVLPFLGELAEAGFTTSEKLLEEALMLQEVVEHAFMQAASEPKISSRDALVARNSVPLVPLATMRDSLKVETARAGKSGVDAHVMRKHMTRAYRDILLTYPNAVYMGEDVTHGGYYLVSHGLAAEFPRRVWDFPPDETALIGCGMGVRQVGLLPVVEIPYAKYLDCGYDIFTEACIMQWITNGSQSCGMLFRLQGFGNGVFGGNYHTHNSLSIPPGLDVLCYSNGPDYARGLKYAMRQVAAGRVVMFVDCTQLLNLREVFPSYSWEFPYVENDDREIDFETVFLRRCPVATATDVRVAVVAYGNTVVTALCAQATLKRTHPNVSVDVVDCPLLSAVPSGLFEACQDYDLVVFADPCKEGMNPLGAHALALHKRGALKSFCVVAAAPTYNPLGRDLTFVNEADITDAVVTAVSGRGLSINANK